MSPNHEKSMREGLAIVARKQFEARQAKQLKKLQKQEQSQRYLARCADGGVSKHQFSVSAGVTVKRTFCSFGGGEAFCHYA